MKARKLRNYSKAVAVKDENGIETGEIRRQPVWVYALGGTPEELARYKAILEKAGTNYHEDEKSGAPLYFAPQFHGNTCIVSISDNDKIYVDDSQQQEMLSVAEQFSGTKVGDHLAELTAKKLFGDMFGSTGATNTAPTAKAEEEEVSPADAEDIDQP